MPLVTVTCDDKHHLLKDSVLNMDQEAPVLEDLAVARNFIGLPPSMFSDSEYRIWVVFLPCNTFKFVLPPLADES